MNGGHDGDLNDLDDGHPGSDDVQRPEELDPKGELESAFKNASSCKSLTSQ